jgi:hypothetical protein
MSSILISIYKIFRDNYSLTIKEIISRYMQDYILFNKNNNKINNNKQYCIEINNIILNLNKYVKNNILLLKNKLYIINRKRKEYISYKKYMKNIIDKSMLVFNDLINTYEELIDSSIDNLDMQFNNIELSDDSGSSVNSFDEDNKVDKNNKTYYVCESFTNSDDYLIDMSLTKCTCKAYKYCNETIKICKHLEYCKNSNLDELKKIELNDDQDPFI